MSDGFAEVTGGEQPCKGVSEAVNIERGEKDCILPILDNGLDRLGARGQNRALLSHVFKKFYR